MNKKRVSWELESQHLGEDQVELDMPLIQIVNKRYPIKIQLNRVQDLWNNR